MTETVRRATGSGGHQSPSGAVKRAIERATGELAHHGAFVVDGAAVILDRVGVVHGQAGGFVDVVWGGGFADQERLGGARANAGRGGVAQSDTRAGDGARFVQPECHADADNGVVTDLALELFVGGAASRGGHRDAHLGHQLVRGETGGEDADVEVVDRDDALATGTRCHDFGIEGQEGGRPVRGGVGVGNRADQRAAVAHQRIADAFAVSQSIG